MAELKWSNVDGSNMTQGLAALQNAEKTMFNRVVGLTDGLSNHLGVMQKGLNDAHDYRKEQNTQDIINELMKTESLEELDRLKQSGLTDAYKLRQKYGTEIDISKINKATSTWAADTDARAMARDSLLDFSDEGKQALDQYQKLMAQGKPKEAIDFVVKSKLSNKMKNQIFDTGLDQLNKNRAHQASERDKAIEIAGEANKARTALSMAQAETERLRQAISASQPNISPQMLEIQLAKNPEYQKALAKESQAAMSLDNVTNTYGGLYRQITGTDLQLSNPQSVQKSQGNSLGSNQSNQQPVNSNIALSAVQAALGGVNTAINSISLEPKISEAQTRTNADTNRQGQFTQDAFRKAEEGTATATNTYPSELELVDKFVSGKGSNEEFVKGLKEGKLDGFLESVGIPLETIQGLTNGTISPQQFGKYLQDTKKTLTQPRVLQKLYAGNINGENLFINGNQKETASMFTDVARNLGTSPVYTSKFNSKVTFDPINNEGNREEHLRSFKQVLPHISQGIADDHILTSWFEKGLTKGFSPSYLMAGLETVVQKAMDRNGTKDAKDVLAGEFDFSTTSNDWDTLNRLTDHVNPKLVNQATERARLLNGQLEGSGTVLAIQTLGGILNGKDANGNVTGRALHHEENITKSIDERLGLLSNTFAGEDDFEKAQRISSGIRQALDGDRVIRHRVISKRHNTNTEDLPMLKKLAEQAKESLKDLPKGSSLGNTRGELQESSSALNSRIKQLEAQIEAQKKKDEK